MLFRRSRPASLSVCARLSTVKEVSVSVGEILNFEIDPMTDAVPRRWQICEAGAMLDHLEHTAQV